MAINWDESLPKDSDYYATHAASVRAFKSTVAGALGQVMNWPGSGGGTFSSAGSLKAGAARSYFTLQSLFSTLTSSTTAGDASLATAYQPVSSPFYVASDTSRAFSQNWASSVTSTSGSTATTINFSGSTTFLGSRSLLEHALYDGVRIRRQYSVASAGATDVHGLFNSSSDTTTLSVSFAPVVYDVPPMVSASLYLNVSAGTGAVMGAALMQSAYSVGGAQFTVSVLSRGTISPAGPSTCTAYVLVISEGTVTV